MFAALMAEWPHQAAAQSAPCTAIQDDAERLACYDRALRATPPAPASPAPTAPAAPATQAPAAQTPAAQSAPAPATQASSASAGKDVTSIVVVSVRTLPGRETSFTTQDGATWVQTDSQRIYGLPDTPFDAELKPGAVGSTFLLPKSSNRAIRVKLVQR
ncbi:MAG TPA: hypothetical protein VGL98_00660 [Gammaproteobacteria bacterium]